MKLAKSSRLLAKRLYRDNRALALIEFAFSLPFMLVLGFGGIETANYAVAHMRVSQMAVTLADNASRFKEEYSGNVPVIREYDINQGFKGAESQASGLDFENNGRMILSSLEYDTTQKKQKIRWQRCWGKAKYNSSYGKQDDWVSSTGMGEGTRKVTTEEGYAVMFVEVMYNYKPLIYGDFLPSQPIHKVAAMFVRDDRALGGYPSNTAGVTKMTC